MKSHVGILQNEIADILVKGASSEGSLCANKTPRQDILTVIKQNGIYIGELHIVAK